MEHLLRRSMVQTWRRKAASSSPYSISQQIALSKRALSTSASPGAIATRRLYRILQRQCVEFSKEMPSDPSGETMFLLQPPLESRNSGHNRILSVNTVDTENDVRNLLMLFRAWNEEEEDDVDEWYASIKKDTSKPSSDPQDGFGRFYGDNELTVWSTISSIQNAIRYAFRNSDPEIVPGQDPQEFQRRMNKFAIRAVKSLSEQVSMWRLTSISYDKGVRVVATSKCIGNSLMGGPASKTPKIKYRFNYRIRVENLSDQDTFQLLGRHWHIQEMDPRDGKTPVGVPIVVDAPNSGAVGQLPVIQPGEAFEYMSGCELETAKGTMGGSFHLAKVPLETPSAMLGNTIPAFSSPDKFEVAVNPFPLEADIAVAA